MKNRLRLLTLCSFALLILAGYGLANPVVRSAAGASAADILDAVNDFRADLGTLNPNVPVSFPSGRREINWDAVPDARSSPNALPANFFNFNSPRGVIFSTSCSGAQFFVSADSDNPTSTPLHFGEIDPSYSTTFQTFSPQRLFTVVGSTEPCSTMTVEFFVPASSTPAETSGFGVVFTDVDIPGHVHLIAYDREGRVLSRGVLTPRKADGGFSFIGVSYGEPRIARVDIVTGKNGLFGGVVDGLNGHDVVAMDDFLYGEPQPIE